MRRTLIAFVVVGMVLQAHGQGSPEEAAIVEVLTARDSALIERHLPKALSEGLDTLDKNTREQLLSRARSIMETKGLKIAQANDSRALLAFDVNSPDADIKHFELVAQRRISDGGQAVLVIACVAPEKTWGEAEVWMRLEDGEWRITELSDPTGFQRIHLDDPELIAEIVHEVQYQNETAAIGGMREIIDGIASYSEQFREVPQRLEMLGGDPNGETTSEHAGLIDPQLASAHEHSGYRFSYERTSIDSYTITATPLEFGKSGTRDFFADQSAVIRVTTEDRTATVNDPPLRSRWNRGSQQ